MAASEISSIKSQRRSRGISAALASAFLEWLLIFMLLINAIFSYLIVKFASHSELQMPCLLCSRLDHILGSRKLKRYWHLIICSKHKSEISSLVHCGVHNKLVDVHGICETCLFSFASISKSNSEKYRMLVGKLGEDSSLNQDPSVVECSSTRQCSCCNEFWTLRRYDQNLMPPARSMDSAAAVNNEQAKTGGFSHDGIGELDHLSRDEYRPLKIDSDAESEDSLCDHDNNATAETKPNKESVVELIPAEPHIITLPDNVASEEFIDPVPVQEPSVSVTQMQSDENNSGAYGHGLEEINWHVSTDEGSPYPETKETLVEVIKEGKSYSIDARDMPVEESKEIDLISEKARENSSEVTADGKFVDGLPSSNGVETPVQGLKESGTQVSEKVFPTSITEADGMKMEATSTAKAVLVTNLVAGENGQKEHNLLDLSDAYKLAVSNRGRQLSGVGKDSSRFSEDLKLLLSQLSAVREQTMMSDISTRVPVSPRISVSPRCSINSDELKSLDASNTIGMQMLQKRMSLERNLSSQSLDGSIVSEIEGESMVDRLKRQVEHDRKLLSALYKELEEERNASAIAANQSMAMITRLQEEKASLHMEALQCLRMMEERAEYDMEALQKTSDLLAEREKVIQDLEAELDYYRTNFPGEPATANTVKPVSDTK